jgi:hypothetical protein
MEAAESRVLDDRPKKTAARAKKKEYLPAATVLCAHEQNFVEQGSIGFGLPHAVAKRGSAGLAWSAYGPEMQSRCF